MKATFAAGCFWGVEQVFSQLKGVKSATSGYTGGHLKDPTYEDVCSGRSGHAEAVQVEFDPKVVSYKELLTLFWKIHNPTTKNRQGWDIGSEYRSVIFYHNEEQKKEALKSSILEQKMYERLIVTEIVPATTFYKAEEYHQKFNEKHGRSCRI